MAISGSSVAGEIFVSVSPEAHHFASKLERQLQAAGLANLGTIAGVALAAGLTAAFVTIGEKFEEMRHKIEQETGATGDVLDGIADTAVRAFTKVPVSLTAAASAVDELFRRGVPLGAQLDRLAEQQLFLAKVTGVDLAQNVEATTGLMARFNIPIADQARELDVLFKAMQLSGRSFSELTSNLQSGGLLLQQFGFSLDESAALMANLGKNAANISPIIAGLRLAFGKITAAGGDPQKVLHDLLAEFTDGTPHVQAAADAINLFGKRSGAELVAQIEAGTFSTQKLLEEITNGKDGIVATGLATLSLGDQFTLLRNKVTASLEGISTGTLHAVEEGLKFIGPPVADLIEGFVRLGTALGPTLGALPVLIAPLQLIVPLIETFTQGLNTTADLVNRIPGPLLVIGGVLTVVALGAFGAADGLVAFFLSLNTGIRTLETSHPILLALTVAIAAIGAAVKLFGHDADPAIKESERLGKTMFDTAQQAGIFHDGVGNATKALADFLRAESGDDKRLRVTLLATGTTVDQLAKNIGLGTEQWDRYKGAALRAAEASGARGIDLAIISEELDQQRRAFEKTAQAELGMNVANGQLTESQVKHIEALSRGRDGEVNWTKALDLANDTIARAIGLSDQRTLKLKSVREAERDLARQLADGTITEKDAKEALANLGLSVDKVATEYSRLAQVATALNEKHDAALTKTVRFTAAYGELARRIALGEVTTTSGAAAMERLGFSTQGAGAAFSAMQQPIDAFVQAAVSALPTVAQAVSKFQSDVESAVSTLSSDIQKREDLNQRLADQQQNAAASAGEAAAKRLRAINDKIELDQGQIARGQASSTKSLDTDLQKRSQIFEEGARRGSEASASLLREIQENNAAIHADYAKLIAANDPAKFTKDLLTQTANIAAFTTNLRKLIDDGFGGLAGQLATLGPTAAGGLAAGLASDKSKAAIADAAVKINAKVVEDSKTFFAQNFPALQLQGEAAGDRIGRGIANGIVKQLVAIFPALADEIKAAAVPIGDGVTSGVSSGITNGAVKLRALIRGEGGRLGGGFIDGMDQGLRDGFPKIEGTVIALTQHGVAVAKSQWKITSPSRVAQELGSLFGEGLALGIASQRNAVGAAVDAATADTVRAASAALSVPTIEVPAINVPPVPPVLIRSEIIPPRVPVLPELPTLIGDAAITPPDLPALPTFSTIVVPSRVSAPQLPVLPTFPTLFAHSEIVAPALPEFPVLPTLVAASVITAPVVPDLPDLPTVVGRSEITSPLIPTLPSLPTLRAHAVIDEPRLPTIPTLPTIVGHSVITQPPVPDLPSLPVLVGHSVVTPPLTPVLPVLPTLVAASRITEPTLPALPVPPTIVYDTLVTHPDLPRLATPPPVVFGSTVDVPDLPTLPVPPTLVFDTRIAPPAIPALPAPPPIVYDTRVTAPVLPTVPDLSIGSFITPPPIPALPDVPDVAFNSSVNAPTLPVVPDLLIGSRINAPTLPTLPTLPDVSIQTSFDVPDLPNVPDLVVASTITPPVVPTLPDVPDVVFDAIVNAPQLPTVPPLQVASEITAPTVPALPTFAAVTIATKFDTPDLPVLPDLKIRAVVDAPVLSKPLSRLISSGLTITGQEGAARADAVQEQRDAQNRVGPLIGEVHIAEKTDPMHIAAELAWLVR